MPGTAATTFIPCCTHMVVAKINQHNICMQNEYLLIPLCTACLMTLSIDGDNIILHYTGTYDSID